jgi:hypothetical protein
MAASMGVSSVPKALELQSSYIPLNAPTTQGMMPQRIASLRNQEVEVMQAMYVYKNNSVGTLLNLIFQLQWPKNFPSSSQSRRQK